MAFKRMTIDGYGQLELNNVAFRRDGRIEAQCKLSATDFANMDAENGMVFAVDKSKAELKLVAADNILPIAINYSTEHMYDERKNALKDFKISLKDNEQFLPRMGYLAMGDLFTTNCIGYEDSEFTSEEAFITALGALATTPLYAVVSDKGAWKVTATATGAYAKVIKKTTTPDGIQKAVQLQILK